MFELWLFIWNFPPPAQPKKSGRAAGPPPGKELQAPGARCRAGRGERGGLAARLHAQLVGYTAAVPLNH
jgi:hypothetical protein